MMNAEGVQGAGRTTRKGTKGASRNVQGREEVFANVSAGAEPLTQKRTLSGGGALQFGDLRLLEDGGEHGGALGSNVVAGEAARDR